MHIALTQDWLDLQAWSATIDPAHIAQLAREHQLLTGKWILFSRPSHVDHAWRRVAEATVKGELGFAARVSLPMAGSSDSHGRGEKDCCLQVLTANYLDKADVERVRLKLRSLCFARMCFKPTIHSVLGIYRGNPWGISPSLHSHG